MLCCGISLFVGIENIFFHVFQTGPANDGLFQLAVFAVDEIMRDGAFIARDLHLFPVVFGEDVVFALVLALHFEEAFGGGTVVGDVDKYHALRLQVGFHLFHFLDSEVAGAAPCGPEINEHHFARMTGYDLGEVSAGVALRCPERVGGELRCQFGLQFADGCLIFSRKSVDILCADRLCGFRPRHQCGGSVELFESSAKCR